jgi:hypothetical protein
MSGPSQPDGKLVWQELLSAKGIEEWAVSRKQPRKLWRVGGISQPGVYRLVFPEDRSCYIGVAGHFGTRLHDHICPKTNQESEHPAKNVSGWSVRGAIHNSLGKCHLQYLTIEGSVNMCGVKLNQHSFEDYFSRLLLENWAIFHAERFEELRPLNRDIVTGIHQGTKDFLRLAKGNIVKVDRRGAVIERGGLGTLL